MLSASVCAFTEASVLDWRQDAVTIQSAVGRPWRVLQPSAFLKETTQALEHLMSGKTEELEGQSEVFNVSSMERRSFVVCSRSCLHLHKG